MLYIRNGPPQNAVANSGVSAQVGSNTAPDNSSTWLNPCCLTTDRGRPTTRTISCGQWSVVGGQTDVPVTDTSSNSGDVKL